MVRGGVRQLGFDDCKRVSAEARLFVFAGLPLQEVQVVFGARVTIRCVPRLVSYSRRLTWVFELRSGPYCRVRRADLGSGHVASQLYCSLRGAVRAGFASTSQSSRKYGAKLEGVWSSFRQVVTLMPGTNRGVPTQAMARLKNLLCVLILAQLLTTALACVCTTSCGATAYFAGLSLSVDPTGNGANWCYTPTGCGFNYQEGCLFGVCVQDFWWGSCTLPSPPPPPTIRSPPPLPPNYVYGPCNSDAACSAACSGYNLCTGGNSCPGSYSFSSGSSSGSCTCGVAGISSRTITPSCPNPAGKPPPPPVISPPPPPISNPPPPPAQISGSVACSSQTACGTACCGAGNPTCTNMGVLSFTSGSNVCTLNGLACSQCAASTSATQSPPPTPATPSTITWTRSSVSPAACVAPSNSAYTCSAQYTQTTSAGQYILTRCAHINILSPINTSSGMISCMILCFSRPSTVAAQLRLPVSSSPVRLLPCMAGSPP